MLSAPPPRPANGERIEVRGAFVNGFSEDQLMFKPSLWIALDYCERRRLSRSAFFGETYGTEISQATSFGGSIRFTITSWISVVPAQSWLSN